MAGLVNVGQHRQARIFRQPAQDARALDQPRPAKALHAGSVGLVVARLEDVGNAEIRRDALDLLGHRARVRLGLDDARPGNQEKLALAHMDRTDFKGMAHAIDCKAQPSPDPASRKETAQESPAAAQFPFSQRSPGPRDSETLSRMAVGSRTGAVFRRSGLSVAPRFLWECLNSQTVNPFPAPATSHPACGFPALGAPVCFVPRVMGPIVLGRLSHLAIERAGSR